MSLNVNDQLTLVDARRRQLTGEPDDKHAPHWANWKAQNTDGTWWYYSAKPYSIDFHGVWEVEGTAERATKGEVLADWRDTLKPVERVEKEMEEPDFKNGDEVDVCCGGDWVPAFYIGKRVSGVISYVVQMRDTSNGVIMEVGKTSIRKAPSERDKFISAMYEAVKTFPHIPVEDHSDSTFYGYIYDAMKDGKLPVPKVKK